MDRTTIKLNLHEKVKLKPIVKRLFNTLGIALGEDYFIAGYKEKKPGLTVPKTFSFRVRAVLKNDKPIVLLDDVITLTFAKDADKKTVPEVSMKDTYLVNESIIIDEVCFQKGEEVVVTDLKYNLSIPLGGTDLPITRGFYSQLRLACTKKQAYKVCIEDGNAFRLVVVYAYNEDEVRAFPEVSGGYLVDTAMVPGTYSAKTIKHANFKLSNRI